MKKPVFTLAFAFLAAVAFAHGLHFAQATQLDGMPFSFKMYEGKAMVIVYMSTTSQACRDAVAFINKLYKEYPRDEVYIAAAFLRESPQELAAFKTGFYPLFPLLYNTQRLQAVAPLETNILPTFVIIDKRHRVTKRVAGLDRNAVREELEKALIVPAPSAKKMGLSWK